MRIEKIHSIKIILMLFLFLLSKNVLLAGEAGKIAGKVLDKESREPLPGINIIVKGTTLGAATDLGGRYFIIGVPPGTYELQASAVGYHTIAISNVRVRVDLTSEINIAMESTVIEIPTVVVTAEQKMVQKDITSTRKTISREDFTELPGFESTRDIFKLHGGTFISSLPQTLPLADGTQLQLRDESVKDIHIRGGRGGEILFLIDGVPVTHPIYGGHSVLELDANAVEQVELLTGAFGAEYGQAQSGVVNITTRSGGDQFKGGVQYKTDNLKFLGTSYNTDYFTLYLSGPEPISKYIFPLLGINSLGKLYYFLSLNGNLTNTPYDNRRIRNKISLFGLHITERQNNLRAITGKLSWDVTSQFRMVFGYNGSKSDWTDFDWLWYFNPNNQPAYKRSNDNFNFTLKHILSKSSYYSLSFGYLGVDFYGSLDGKSPSDFWKFYKSGIEYNYNAWKTFSNNYNILPDSFRTTVKPPQLDPLTQFFDGRGYNTIWRNDKTSTLTIKGDITSQIGNDHLVKTGFEAQYNDISYIDVQHGGVQLSNYGDWAFNRDTTTPSPTMPPGPFPEFSQNRWVFHVFPLSGSAFIQDKFEKEFLILNLGLRFDWTWLGKTLDSKAWKTQWEEATGLESNWNKFKYKISPRLGVSFPITERTVLFFSYGHFYQLPELQYFYRDPYSGGITGNPHLDYERTILYEFGLTHQILDDWAVDIKSYAKDISHQVGTTQLKAALGIPVALFDNKSYGRARGLEFELEKRHSNFYSGKVTYTIQWADVYASSAFEDYIKSLTDFPSPIRERRAGWDIRHQIISQLSLMAMENQHLNLFGLKLPDDWNVTVLSSFSSGQPYTPFTFDLAQAQKLENIETSPSISTIDLRLSKGFRLLGVRLSLEVDVFNLFDQNNIQIGYGFNTATGKPFRYGDIQPGTNQFYDWYTMFRLMDPRQFSTGRYIKAGLRIDW